MKRNLSLVLAIIMVCVILAGCGGGAANSTTAQISETQQGNQASDTTAAVQPQEIVKLNYVIPGNATKDNDQVTTTINDKLKADNAGVELVRTFVPWNVWDQKINLMLSTGEEFDMFHVMSNVTPLSSYFAKGAIVDLTEVVGKYGEGLKKVVPEDMFDGAKINGKIYAIPTYWVEQDNYGVFSVRLDVLKQNNLEIPKTPDELLNTGKVIMDNWKGKSKPYIANMNASYDSYAANFGIMHRTYDAWPFAVQLGMIYVGSQGDVKSWYETPEFKKDCEFMRKAYTMGLINPDILTIKQEQIFAQLGSGEDWLGIGTGLGDLLSIQKNNPSATNQDVVPVYFNPEKPYMRPLTVKNENAVPINSKHPEAAVKFLSWLWANQDNYDLYFYGIEGKHFEKVGDRGIKRILNPSDNSMDYTDSDWMSGNINYLRYDDVTGFPAINKLLYTPDAKAVNNPAANFTFDSTAVKAQYADIQTQAAAVMTPILMGVMDFDKNFPVALEKMKSAGLDTVVQEYKKQFDAWRAADGK